MHSGIDFDGSVVGLASTGDVCSRTSAAVTQVSCFKGKFFYIFVNVSQ